MTTEEQMDVAGFAQLSTDIGTESASNMDPNCDNLPPECVAYEVLLHELEHRSPTDEEFRQLQAHETSCTSGRHSEEGIEQALGLEPGALRNGSPQDGLPSPREVVSALIKKHLPADVLV